MARRQPDRVPIDLGGTPLTGMRPGCKAALRDLLGFSSDDGGGEAPGGRGEGLDERIMEWAGADFRTVGYIVDLPGPHARRISPRARVNCWGVRSEVVEGEWQITHSPLKGASREELEQFRWPEPRVDEAVLEGWTARARRLRQEDRHVVVAGHPVFGILELGCWMCGYDDFLFKMAAEPDFVRAFFDKVLEIQLAVIDAYYRALGPWIDLTTSGDDFGTQMGPLVSPGMFDDLIAPYLAERVKRTKELGGCLYWHHSCGSVEKLLDGLIDCGVDIINPVQTSAADMEPRRLKERYGARVVFWGGVDVQQFLPRARAEDVPAHVEELIDALGAGGGYVMAPAHEIQDDVPPENIVAWIEAARR
jgi:uroporphyrinogen decarboxylase